MQRSVVLVLALASLLAACDSAVAPVPRDRISRATDSAPLAAYIMTFPCDGPSVDPKAVPSGGTGSYTYSWEWSSTGDGTFTVVGSTTNQILDLDWSAGFHDGAIANLSVEVHVSDGVSTVTPSMIRRCTT